LNLILQLDDVEISKIKTLNIELIDNRANYYKQMKQIEEFIQ
jgi:hypothetical protein